MSHAAAVKAWPALIDQASASYRPAGRFALHFARGKLRWDPVFRHLLMHGLIAPGSRVSRICAPAWCSVRMSSSDSGLSTFCSMASSVGRSFVFSTAS